MLSYRHAFHIGNHADVLKHAVLLYCQDYLKQKDTPFLVVDTHAGAGQYLRDAKLVRGKDELNTGLGRLWLMRREGMPSLVQRYLEAVSEVQPDPSALSVLPGSPVLLARNLRTGDGLRTFEIHPTDFPLLAEALKGRGRRVKADKADGLEQLKGLLPSPSRRALVIIDPPYEMKSDYIQTTHAMREALARQSNTTLLIWVPMLARFEVERLLRQAFAITGVECLRASLKVKRPLADGLGLTGSHMLVFNPPFGLQAACEQALPWLVQQLGQDDQAAWEIALSSARPMPEKASPPKTKGG
jgi:23S rRNA (adenine2030-N6)-methyltransferase